MSHATAVEVIAAHIDELNDSIETWLMRRSEASSALQYAADRIADCQNEIADLVSTMNHLAGAE